MHALSYATQEAALQAHSSPGQYVRAFACKLTYARWMQAMAEPRLLQICQLWGIPAASAPAMIHPAHSCNMCRVLEALYSCYILYVPEHMKPNYK